MSTLKSLGGEGVLTESDLPELSAAAKKILDLMRDGLWHSATEIIAKSGQREGLRRMRELRGDNWTVERRRNGASREFDYRLA